VPRKKAATGLRSPIPLNESCGLEADIPGSNRNLAAMANPFTARWNITGNNLCLGKWEIQYLGQLLKLDAARRENDMGTFGIFSYIYPDDEELAEGLLEDEWLPVNAGWLSILFAAHGIPVDEEHMRWFYQAVNPHDWRCGSCGGCI